MGATVTRLTEGESGRSVARWASKLGIEGAAGHWRYWHWEKLIQAVAKQVRRAKEKLPVKRLLRPAQMPEPPVPPAIEVQEQVEAQVVELECRDEIPESAQQVWMHVESTIEKLKAEQVLQYLIYRQIRCCPS
jgi:hypothetical protein